ncbi:MAG: isoprenylcysteine carboxylmethyltransferase family protein [Xanthomonadaceae bacterium]|jgi:protein-S-isoprenylcysteine O-methyltransferase Ste14|nr:isoprenylcysteine carboxylmethyltransferase family protein [Xanthomonadaceae bacterium]MBH2044636.1 isoprenylcysteine carboxylmethyltransferase family protein [Comamonadaceae bacterium]
MNAKVLGQSCVALQFGLLSALAVVCMPEASHTLPGTVTWLLWLASVGLGLWTLSVNRPGNFNIRPEPRASGHLVQNGPYRWVRHPMYGSVLLLAAGASVWLGSVIGWGLLLALLGVLMVKAHLEEKWLLQRYTEYGEYRKCTWRLLPWIY